MSGPTASVSRAVSSSEYSIWKRVSTSVSALAAARTFA